VPFEGSLRDAYIQVPVTRKTRDISSVKRNRLVSSCCSCCPHSCVWVIKFTWNSTHTVSRRPIGSPSVMVKNNMPPHSVKAYGEWSYSSTYS